MRAAAAPVAAFPWEEVMAVGLGRLGLSPAAFWALSLKELSALVGGFGGGGNPRPDPARLRALMARAEHGDDHGR